MATEAPGATPDAAEGGATPPKDTAPPATPAPPAAPPATDGELGDGGKAAIQAEREARKAAEKTAKDAQAMVDRMKTALGEKQSAEQTATEAQAEAQAARAETLRLRVGMAVGLPADLVPRLVGETEAELTEDAKRLQAMLKPAKSKNDAKAGSGAAGTNTQLSGNELLKAALGR